MSRGRYRHRVHFALLPKEEQLARVRRLAAQGWGDHAIAELIGWHVQQVRRTLAPEAT